MIGIDALASLARTALDDPAALPEEVPLCEDPSEDEHVVYAIARLDQIINLLNPSEWTPGKAADALEVLGAHIGEVSDTLSDWDASAMLDDALDRVDEVIRRLRQG